MTLHKYYSLIKEKTTDKSIVTNELEIAENILNASFIKNLEFNLSITASGENNLFFFLPILRGLCEDIIFINYTFNVIEKSDRQVFILLCQALDWEKSIAAQDTYFSSVRDFQPVLTVKMINDIILDKIDVDLIQNTLREKYGWRRKFPTVKQIAEDGAMSDLYDFLYAATSRLVHFNPQNLLQMTWGEIDRNVGKIKKIKISLEHFKKYYSDFCLFYGFLLFKTFVNTFQEILKVDLSDELTQIEDFFKAKRWPELITFEEMNISVEEGRKMFHLEKNGLKGFIAESIRINMEKEKN